MNQDLTLFITKKLFSSFLFCFLFFSFSSFAGWDEFWSFFSLEKNVCEEVTPEDLESLEETYEYARGHLPPDQVSKKAAAYFKILGNCFPELTYTHPDCKDKEVENFSGFLWIDQYHGPSRDHKVPNLRCANLTGIQARSSSLVGFNQMGSSMIGLVFYEKASFYKANLSKARLIGSQYTETIFRDAILKGALLRGATFIGADFTNADLTEAFLGPRSLQDVKTKAKRTQRSLLEAIASRPAILKKAIFRDAILVDTNLKGVDLQEADLTGANLKFADFEKADLTGANLKGNPVK